VADRVVADRVVADRVVVDRVAVDIPHNCMSHIYMVYMTYLILYIVI
jgi:hypothetical protein